MPAPSTLPSARATYPCGASAWLVEERELRDDPLLGSKPPKLDTQVVPALTDDRPQGPDRGVQRL